jgi:hypothetical protein
VVVDLALACLPRVGPVGEVARADAAEDLVELGLAHQEGVVLHLDLHALGVEKVERHLVVHLHAEEGPEGHRFGPPEELGEELGGGTRVAGVHDGVVQLDGHGRNLKPNCCSLTNPPGSFAPVVNSPYLPGPGFP